MNAAASSKSEYFCPGDKHPITRALHLSRLAEFYAACRNCEHRGDTGTLSAKMVERLQEAWTGGRPPAVFCEEGFSGASPNELTPSVARQVAAAFGLWMESQTETAPMLPSTPSFPRSSVGTQFRDAPASQEVCNDYDSGKINLSAPTGPHPLPLSQWERGDRCIAVASDGRPLVTEIFAAVFEGLRFAACEAIDLGPATSASMQFAIDHFELDGGILVGNSEDKPQSICLKFWGPGPQRMFGKPTFQPLEALLQNGLDRPARSFGPQSRVEAETPYLAALAERFHGLRPLKFVVESTSRPWVDLLEKLLRPTACRIIPCRVLPREFAGQIVADVAHFGVRSTSNGERCTFFDQRGSEIDAERFRDAVSDLENEPQKQKVPPDALTDVARFLRILSRDDRPCSKVLDERAGGK
jgi:phosphomannomutase